MAKAKTELDYVLGEPDAPTSNDDLYDELTRIDVQLDQTNEHLGKIRYYAGIVAGAAILAVLEYLGVLDLKNWTHSWGWITG